MSSRTVLYDLLSGALIEIRAWTGSEPVDEEARLFVNRTAGLVHNWPEGLKNARTDEDFDRLLAECWRRRDRRTDPWMRDRLSMLGVDADLLE